MHRSTPNPLGANVGFSSRDGFCRLWEARRAPLFHWIWLLILCSLIAAAQAGPPPAELEVLHADLWKRFMQPNGVLLDYNTPAGDVALPSAEEALQGKPNALAWWTPMENGAFFTGIYLDAAIRRWQMTGKAEDREHAKKLADGLLLCASVSNEPGFIARGVLSDGTSHYAMGSNDQTAPWFYGLWRYVSSGTVPETDRARIVAKMDEIASALKRLGWKNPCDPIGGILPGQNFGWFNGYEFASACRKLFITRVMAELSGSPEWRQAYGEALAEKKYERTRLDCVDDGMGADFAQDGNRLKYGALWCYVCAQLMLRELADLEQDPGIRDRYLASLRLNARAVEGLVTDTLPPDFGSVPFNTDWRMLNSIWSPQTTVQETRTLADRQLALWKNNGLEAETKSLRDPFSAACIVFSCPDRNAMTDAVAERCLKLIRLTPWPKVCSSYGFFAETAWYLSQPFPKSDASKK